MNVWQELHREANTISRDKRKSEWAVYNVDRLHSLIHYASALGAAGVETGQLYSRHARVCNEIEKELGIESKDNES